MYITHAMVQARVPMSPSLVCHCGWIHPGQYSDAIPTAKPARILHLVKYKIVPLARAKCAPADAAPTPTFLCCLNRASQDAAAAKPCEVWTGGYQSRPRCYMAASEPRQAGWTQAQWMQNTRGWEWHTCASGFATASGRTLLLGVNICLRLTLLEILSSTLDQPNWS